MDIIVIKYDLPKKGKMLEFYDSLEKQIIEKLKENSCYKKDALYRSFPLKRWNLVKKYGTDDPTTTMTWAGRDGFDTHDFMWVLQCAFVKNREFGPIAKIRFKENRMAIVCYDPKHLNITGIRGQCSVKEGKSFKEAVIALILLKPN
jgi:hypothetical protein